jgi:hypothetical protein
MRCVIALLSIGFVSATSASAAFAQTTAPTQTTSPTQTTAPTGQSIADTATFGAVATLAPLCGLRDEAWSSDLRRAAMQTATGSSVTNDAALSQAPGNNQVAAALGYGDMEALEDFAADTPAVTCASLRGNPALGRADAAVDAFRRRRNGKPVG